MITVESPGEGSKIRAVNAALAALQSMRGQGSSLWGKALPPRGCAEMMEGEKAGVGSENVLGKGEVL